MSSNFLKRFMLICCALLFVITSNIWSKAQEKEKELTGEGVVAAYQRNLRCPGCEASRGLATRVEYWIVRIDNWLDGTGRGERWIRVEFNIYDRSPTTAEINHSKLRFKLRDRREDEHTDCLGEIRTGSEPPFTWRKAELSDYERTKEVSLDEIPLLPSMPCLIADDPPVVVE